jgi:hypothetical protein
MTFLEAAAATALLGMVAAALVGVMSFLSASQARQALVLAASELANRLVLMYLDDPTAMPEGTRPIAYGPHEYRWEYAEEPLTLIEAVPGGRDPGRPQTLDPNRFVQVTVRVWLSERSGGAARPVPGVPSATLTRMMDPVALRNPDSGDNLLNNPTRMQEFMRRMMGFRDGTGGGTGGRGRERPGGGRGGGR